MLQNGKVFNFWEHGVFNSEHQTLNSATFQLSSTVELIALLVIIL